MIDQDILVIVTPIALTIAIAATGLLSHRYILKKYPVRHDMAQPPVAKTRVKRKPRHENASADLR